MSWQAETAHDAIHHERRAREIAGVFKQREQEEKQANLRQKHNGSRDATNHTINEQTRKIAFRKCCSERSAKPRACILDQRHRQFCQAINREEDRRHREDEDDRAENRMRERRVETIGQTIALAADGVWSADARGDGLVDPRWREARRKRLRRKLARRAHRCEQGFDTGARAAVRLHARNAECACESLRIDGQAARTRQISHGERNRDRPSKCGDRTQKPQSAREIRRVEDHKQRFRHAALEPARETIAAELRFGQLEVDRVDARKINKLNFCATKCTRTNACFNGRTGEIRGLRTHTAQTIEERRLADVWVAHHRDARRGEQFRARSGACVGRWVIGSGAHPCGS